MIGIAVVILVPLVAVGWWLLSPLVFDTTVDEEFPMAYLAEVPPDMTRQQVEDRMVEAAETDAAVADEMPDAMETGGGPVKLKAGSFTGADSFHKGSGTATIYRGPDGGHLVRFESFRVTNGPALRVILSPHPNPGSSDEVHTTGYVDLGALKGNVGNQNYSIPEGADVSSIGSVVIYCQPFKVVFSVASLQDAG